MSESVYTQRVLSMAVTLNSVKLHARHKFLAMRFLGAAHDLLRSSARTIFETQSEIKCMPLQGLNNRRIAAYFCIALRA